MLSSGFHPAALFTPLSSGKDTILIADLSPFHSSVCFDPALDFCRFHPFHGFICAFLHVINPTSFFNFCCDNSFIGIVHEGDGAVLVAVCVSAVSIIGFILRASTRVVCFGVVLMEEEVQDRVQVEVEREEQGIGETHGKEQGEEQRVKEQTLNRTTWMTMSMG